MNNAERVKAGASLLDDKRPGWESEIDCAILDIASGCRCILGQLYGQYGIGLGALNVSQRSGLHGFSVAVGGVDELNELWREEIAARRLQSVPVEVGMEAYC